MGAFRESFHQEARAVFSFLSGLILLYSFLSSSIAMIRISLIVSDLKSKLFLELSKCHSPLISLTSVFH